MVYCYGYDESIAMSNQPTGPKEIIRQVETDLDVSVQHEAILASSKKLWRDFAELTDLSRTQKPETWAAAVKLTVERMWGHPASFEEAGRQFKVSAHSVSSKHRRIVKALELQYLDDRYTDETNSDELFTEVDELLKGLPLLEIEKHRKHALMEVVAKQQRAHAEQMINEGWQALESDNTLKAAMCFLAAGNFAPNREGVLHGMMAVSERFGQTDVTEQIREAISPVEREQPGGKSQKDPQNRG